MSCSTLANPAFEGAGTMGVGDLLLSFASHAVADPQSRRLTGFRTLLSVASVFLLFTFFTNTHFPWIFPSGWAQTSSKGRKSEGRCRHTKDFQSLCISPVMRFIFRTTFLV